MIQAEFGVLKLELILDFKTKDMCLKRFIYIVSGSQRSYVFVLISRTKVAVGSVFNDTRKVKVLSLPETTKGKSTFRAKAPRRELTPDEGPSLETSIFPLSFQVVKEPLPFAYVFVCFSLHYRHWQRKAWFSSSPTVGDIHCS